MKQLWVEKYRPEKFDEYIFQDDSLRDLCMKFVAEREIPNLLIAGTHGTGKSTMARVLIKEMGVTGFDLLRINASSKTGIDAVRGEIESFVTGPVAFGSAFKIVYLEEADRLTKNAQDALKDVTESYSDKVRFILTCNSIDKISGPIQSRFQTIEVNDLPRSAIEDVVCGILDNENVEVPDIEELSKFIDTYYPDLRKTINSLQKHSVSGVLTPLVEEVYGHEIIDKWKEIWTTKPDYDKLVELVPGADNNNVEELFRIMYDNVEKLGKDRMLGAILSIEEHLYRSETMADQEINLHACLIQSFGLLE